MTPSLAAAAVPAPLLVELGALLLGLAVLGHLAARAGLSPIPLYLLGGLAFGTGGLVPLDAPQEFIEVGAEIGVLLLLLMLGLEYTPQELVANMRRHAPSGLLDLLLNAGPGLACGLLLGWDLPAALALAGVTWVSSSGIVAKLLGDLGRLANRETPAVLSILVIEDLAMAVYLPLLTALLAGAGLLAAGTTLAVAVVCVGTLLLVSLRFGAQLTRLLRASDPENLVLRLLGLTLLVAGLAQAAQVSAAVGAFLVGIALSEEIASRARALLAPLRDLFAAVFFVFFGLQTDPRQLPEALSVAVALAVVTGLGKVGSGWYAAGRAGAGNRARLRAGTALIARGEFSIVIAGLALSAGIEPRLGPLAAAYVLLLAVTGPLLARASDLLYDAVQRARAGPRRLRTGRRRP